MKHVTFLSLVVSFSVFLFSFASNVSAQNALDVKYEYAGFTFVLHQCRISGGDLFCDLTITSNDEDKTLSVADLVTGNKSRIVDNNGNEYYLDNIMFGNLKGTAKLVANLKTKLTVKFTGISAAATEIALLQLNFDSIGRSYWSMQFRNIPIVGRSNSQRILPENERKSTADTIANGLGNMAGLINLLCELSADFQAVALERKTGKNVMQGVEAANTKKKDLIHTFSGRNKGLTELINNPSSQADRFPIYKDNHAKLSELMLNLGNQMETDKFDDARKTAVKIKRILEDVLRTMIEEWVGTATETLTGNNNPDSTSINQISAQPPAPTYQTQGVTFTLEQCKLRNPDIICLSTITSNSGDRNIQAYGFSLNDELTTMIDNFGNKYTNADMKFANAGQSITLVENVPIKSTVTFYNVNATATEISSLKLWYALPGADVSKFYIQYRKIPIVK